MDYEWDPVKAEANLVNHGVAFEAVQGVDWDTALVVRDIRHSAERRFMAYGVIGARVHVVVFTNRGGARRIISMWKANRRDTRRYEEWRDGENTD